MEMKKAFDNIFSWIASLSKIAKAISLIIVLATWVAAGITAYNNWIIKKHESTIVTKLNGIDERLQINTETINDVKNEVKSISSNQVTVSNQVGEMSETVDLLNRNVNTQGKAISNIFQKQKMYQENINFLQDIINDQKKKSMTGMLPTPSNQSN